MTSERSAGTSSDGARSLLTYLIAPASRASCRRSGSALEEHEDAQPGPCLSHEPCRDDAVDVRHVDVHQHHVRVLPARELHGLLAVLRDPDHVELGPVV